MYLQMAYFLFEYNCFETMVKNLPATAAITGDAGLIPGLGRSLGGGNDNPLQYSGWENPMNRGA